MELKKVDNKYTTTHEGHQAVQVLSLSNDGVGVKSFDHTKKGHRHMRS